MSRLFQNRQWWLDSEQRPSTYVPFFNEMGAVQYREFSKYPFIVRDITFNTQDSIEDKLKDIILNGGKYLETVDWIDEYNDGIKRAITFRLVFQSLERNLTKEEVDDTMNKLI